ncbi:MAG: CHAT domain-containing protein [Proteobacteria bacterium]|nr:CHAT domain-containing protein [Pseudomonadota bacterium]
MSRARAAAGVAKNLLLIGDPTTARSDFAPLPDAAKEIQQVRQHFQVDSEVVVSQKSAIPAAYATSNPGDFRYIHFAAHGTASRLSPLDSAVVLSPPPAEPEELSLMHSPRTYRKPIFWGVFQLYAGS